MGYQHGLLALRRRKGQKVYQVEGLLAFIIGF